MAKILFEILLEDDRGNLRETDFEDVIAAIVLLKPTDSLVFRHKAIQLNSNVKFLAANCKLAMWSHSGILTAFYSLLSEVLTIHKTMPSQSNDVTQPHSPEKNPHCRQRNQR